MFIPIRTMAASFPEHLQKTQAAERGSKSYKAMNEMKKDQYRPSVDELEARRQWHEPKSMCKGTCGREYCETTLAKYKGMCSACRDTWLYNNGGFYSEENKTNRGFFEELPGNMSSDEEPSSSDDSEYSEGDSGAEEEEEKPKKKKKKQKSKKSARHVSDDEEDVPEPDKEKEFIAPEEVVEYEYEREDKEPPKTKLEEEAADLAHYTSLINKQDKRKHQREEEYGPGPRLRKRRRIDPEEEDTESNNVHKKLQILKELGVVFARFVDFNEIKDGALFRVRCLLLCETFKLPPTKLADKWEEFCYFQASDITDMDYEMNNARYDAFHAYLKSSVLGKGEKHPVPDLEDPGVDWKAKYEVLASKLKALASREVKEVNCRRCGKPANKTCSVCKLAVYCSKECQTENCNIRHKHRCKFEMDLKRIVDDLKR